MEMESLLQYGGAVEREMSARADSLASRTSAWLVAGNGAGLLLCFNALAEHHICDWSAIRPLAAVFMLGLVNGFSSVVLTMRMLELSAARMLRLNSSMRVAASHISLRDRLLNSLPSASQEVKAEMLRLSEKAEADARSVMSDIDTIASEPTAERRLGLQSSATLGFSALLFLVGIGVAVWGEPLALALCPAVSPEG